jgi:hypothetical protein
LLIERIRLRYLKILVEKFIKYHNLKNTEMTEFLGYLISYLYMGVSFWAFYELIMIIWSFGKGGGGETEGINFPNIFGGNSNNENTSETTVTEIQRDPEPEEPSIPEIHERPPEIPPVEQHEDKRSERDAKKLLQKVKDIFDKELQSDKDLLRLINKISKLISDIKKKHPDKNKLIELYKELLKNLVLILRYLEQHVEINFSEEIMRIRQLIMEEVKNYHTDISEEEIASHGAIEDYSKLQKAANKAEENFRKKMLLFNDLYGLFKSYEYLKSITASRLEKGRSVFSEENKIVAAVDSGTDERILSIFEKHILALLVQMVEKKKKLSKNIDKGIKTGLQALDEIRKDKEIMKKYRIAAIKRMNRAAGN